MSKVGESRVRSVAHRDATRQGTVLGNPLLSGASRNAVLKHNRIVPAAQVLL
jgi:hypothetical protein